MVKWWPGRPWKWSACRGLRVIVPVDDLLEPHLAVEYLDLESAAEVEPLAE